METKQTTRWIIWLGLTAMIGSKASAERGTALADSPVSISVLDGNDLQSSGITNIADVLRNLPSGPVNPGVAEVFGGHQLDLRGLDLKRPLILVNGRTGSLTDYVALDADRTEYLGASLGLLYGIQTPSTTLVANAGVGLTHYTDTDIPRDGDDETIFDFTANLGLVHDFSDSISFESLTSLHHGGHGHFARGYLRSGVLFSNVTDVHSNNALHYRFDKLALGETGLGFSTALEYGTYAEDNRDDVDSYRLRLTQEARFTTNVPNLTIFGEAAGGMREWELWSPVDSEHFRLGGGLRGQAGGIDYSFKAGLHHREYDDLDSDRDELYAVFSIGGNITDRLAFGAIGDYAVQDLFVNFGGKPFVDPIGFRGGIRFKYDYSDQVDVNLGVNYMRLKSDFAPSLFSSETIERFSATLSVDFRIRENLTITPGIQHECIDYDAFGDSHGWNGQLALKASF